MRHWFHAGVMVRDASRCSLLPCRHPTIGAWRRNRSHPALGRARHSRGAPRDGEAQPNLEAPELWRPAVRQAIQELPPFDITLGPVDWFGDGIVFLAVSDEIRDLHRLVLEAVESVVRGERFEYEGDAYVPHLTLGADFVGETNDQLLPIAAAARAQAWAPFRVHEVVEFRRQRPDQDYVPVDAYPLARA